MANEDLTKVRSLIQKGKKIFLRHTHKKGFLDAQWQGEHHLAYVSEGLDEETDTFKVIWRRSGVDHEETVTLNTVDQVKEMESPLPTVLIEDDNHGENFHSAKIVDYNSGMKSLKIKIRWDTGYEDIIDASRAFWVVKKRNRTKTNRFVASPAKRNKVASGEKSAIDIISISSSLSDDESMSNPNSSGEIPSPARKLNTDGKESLGGSRSKDSKSCNTESKAKCLSGRTISTVTGNSKAPTLDRSKILLHGFISTTEQMKDPKEAVKVIRNILDKALDEDCNQESAEFKEVLIDANMHLQEILLGLSKRTKFLEVSASTKIAAKKVDESETNNKNNIIELSKSYGLTQQQTDDLFQNRLETDCNGFYSINEAIAKIENIKEDIASCESEEKVGSDDIESKTRFDLLGKRVKTVLDCGKEYEGTISSVHYRVNYDDGDTETFTETEAFENLACNNISESRECSVSALELFSGCSLLSNLCKRKGMEVMSVDIDKDSNATFKSDVLSDQVLSLVRGGSFDYIHASPVCCTYSLLAGSKHRSRECYNISPESHNADGVLLKLYFSISESLAKNPIATFTIENPVGRMQSGRIMTTLFEGKLGFKKFKIHYCRFGRGDMKPTHIWTNDYKLGNILLKLGGKCTCPTNHEEGVRNTPGKNFAALPMQLCQIISKYVYTKHTQLKFDALGSIGGIY